MSKVSIIRCGGYGRKRLYEALKESVDLIGGIGAFVKPGQRVLIKPNLLKIAGPEEAVITHPEFIRAVVRLVKNKTERIYIGDSPGGLIKADAIYEQCGIKQLASEEHVELVRFDRVTKAGNIPFAKIKDEVDVLISLPKFKTHNVTVITAAVKNVFGLVPGLYKVNCHKDAPNFRTFATTIAKICSLARPQLNIVDAILAMDGDGPGTGDPYKLGLIAASADAVAVDTVLSKIIGLKPTDVVSTKEACRLGVGEADIDKIDIAGEPLNDVCVRDFRLSNISLVYRLPNIVTRTLLRFIPLIIGIDKRKCTRCMMCKDICPQQAIRITNGNIKIDWRRCILCLCCSEICPQGAVYLRFFRRRKKREE